MYGYRFDKNYEKLLKKTINLWLRCMCRLLPVGIACYCADTFGGYYEFCDVCSVAVQCFHSVRVTVNLLFVHIFDHQTHTHTHTYATIAPNTPHRTSTLLSMVEATSRFSSRYTVVYHFTSAQSLFCSGSSSSGVELKR